MAMVTTAMDTPLSMTNTCSINVFTLSSPPAAKVILGSKKQKKNKRDFLEGFVLRI